MIYVKDCKKKERKKERKKKERKKILKSVLKGVQSEFLTIWISIHKDTQIQSEVTLRNNNVLFSIEFIFILLNFILF